jgi:hypothetical protein
MLIPVGIKPGSSRADRIGGNLKDALNNASSMTRIHKIELGKFKPNADNNRDLVIPLITLLNALKINSPESLIYIEDGQMVFPERSELPHDIELNFESKHEEVFYDGIRELALSIYRHGGLIHAVECTKVKDDYVLNVGHRRWYASHFVPDKSYLEAVLKKEGEFTNLQKSVRRWDENHKRQNQMLLERVDHVKDVINNYKAENAGKMSQKAIAAILALSTYEMSYYKKIISCDMSDPERKIVSDNNLDDLRTVADICNVKSEDKRLFFFNVYLKEGNTSARKKVKAYMDTLLLETNKADIDKPLKVSNKLTPKAKPVANLVVILGKSNPELVVDIDASLPPAAILEIILKRLEKGENK